MPVDIGLVIVTISAFCLPYTGPGRTRGGWLAGDLVGLGSKADVGEWVGGGVFFWIRRRYGCGEGLGGVVARGAGDDECRGEAWWGSGVRGESSRDAVCLSVCLLGKGGALGEMKRIVEAGLWLIRIGLGRGDVGDGIVGGEWGPGGCYDVREGEGGGER